MSTQGVYLRPTPATAPRAPRRSGGSLLPATAARLIGFALLALFAALHWATLLEPATRGHAWGSVALALGVAAVLLRAAPLDGWRRRAVLAATIVGAVAIAMLAADISLRLLGPRNWDELSAGIGDGLAALPDLRVPYRGIEPWTRTVLQLGGGLLLVVSALLAFWPRRGGGTGWRTAALVAVVATFATPVVVVSPDRAYLAGAALTLLVAAFLWLDRVELARAPVAALAAVTAVLVGLAAAPILDAQEPWVDYEDLARSISDESRAATFSWDHRYGPIDWPRRGRQVLRIGATRPTYWKAETLTAFDGRRWLNNPQGFPDDAGALQPGRNWIQKLRVTVRELRSDRFIAAGTTLTLDSSRPRQLSDGRGGHLTQGRPLRRGDAYRAEVYVPRPSASEMRAAGPVGEEFARDYRTIRLEDGLIVEFPAFGEDPLAWADRLEESEYARTYALARRLAEASATPYDFARRVEAHLARGYDYSERPPVRRVPLEAFLFIDRRGYCQQFSGAMALLLRMGGVPARVATGFTPGTYDRTRREYVVTDLDAHSWVEVYFADIGWVTFDPTPIDAPARSPERDEARAAQGEGLGEGLGGDVPEAGPPAAAGGEERGGFPWAALAVLLAAVLGYLVLRAFLRRRRRAIPAVERALRELTRGMRRTGRPLSPATTLRELEGLFRGSPGAARYVATLSAARYGGEQAAPTASQRRALRRALAGRSLLGRLRGYWAVPPHLP